MTLQSHLAITRFTLETPDVPVQIEHHVVLKQKQKLTAYEGEGLASFLEILDIFVNLTIINVFIAYIVVY